MIPDSLIYLKEEPSKDLLKCIESVISYIKINRFTELTENHKLQLFSAYKCTEHEIYFLTLGFFTLVCEQKDFDSIYKSFTSMANEVKEDKEKDTSWEEFMRKLHKEIT